MQQTLCNAIFMDDEMTTPVKNGQADEQRASG
jgi:hypothetical protein